jgi:hypothetical protein
MSSYNNPLNFPTKDVRARCRAKHGAKWWDVGKEIKKKRMDDARLDLRMAEEQKKGQKAEQEKKPLKKVYRLRINDEEEGRTSKMWEVDAQACIGPKVEFKKLSEKEEARGPGFWSVYLFSRSQFSEEELEEEEEEDDDEGSQIWLGSHPIPGYGDKVHYGHVKKGDNDEDVAQTLLSMEHGFGTYTEEGGFMHGCEHPIDNKHLVIEKSIWENDLKPETRERLLRDSFAKTIYIADTWF